MSEPSHPGALRPLSDAGKELRLLSQSGSYNDNIFWKLSTWTINDAPPYEAVSYQWGDPKPEHPVCIDGLVYRNGRNCCYALTQAFQHAQCQYIWMDAICINQRDTVEKSAQVTMMASIYARSQRVLVSLGEATGDDCFLIDMLCTMEKACALVSERRAPRADWLYRLGQANRDKLMTALKALASKPYWSRLWIIQELYMAPSRLLMCGRSTLDLAIIARFIDELDPWFDNAIQEAEDIPRDCLKNDPGLQRLQSAFFKDFHHESGLPMAVLIAKIADQRETLKVQRVRGRLVDVLRRFESWQCSDLRDRIYGLTALVHSDGPPVIPDYKKSVYEVALDALRSDSGEQESCLELAVMLCNLLRLSEVDVMRSVMTSRLDKVQPTLTAAYTAGDTLPVRIWDQCTIWKDPKGNFVATARSCLDDEAVAGLASPWESMNDDLTASGESFTEVSTRAKVEAVSTSEGPFALVCSIARAGDRLVLLETKGGPYDAGWPKLGLVIRKRTFRTFSIVGYVLVCADFWACDTRYDAPRKCGFPNLPHTPPYKFVFEGRFDPVDLLVLGRLQYELDKDRRQSLQCYTDLLLTRPLRHTMSSYVIANNTQREWWEQALYSTHASTGWP